MLTETQSAPGSRIADPSGNEFDVVARFATDGGPFVIVAPVGELDALPIGVVVSEGALRDHEDVAYVGLTADAKQEAAAKQAAAQTERDRIAREERIKARQDAEEQEDRARAERIKAEDDARAERIAKEDAERQAAQAAQEGTEDATVPTVPTDTQGS